MAGEESLGDRGARRPADLWEQFEINRTKVFHVKRFGFISTPRYHALFKGVLRFPFISLNC
jgi:hypothetical protein